MANNTSAHAGQPQLEDYLPLQTQHVAPAAPVAPAAAAAAECEYSEWLDRTMPKTTLGEAQTLANEQSYTQLTVRAEELHKQLAEKKQLRLELQVCRES